MSIFVSICILINFSEMNACYEYDQGFDFDAFTLIQLKDDQIFPSLEQVLVNKTNAEGWTLLMYACNNGQKAVVEYLLNRGARTSKTGFKTPLMIAIGSGDFDIVKLVLNFEDLEARDGRGWTALFYAVFYGRHNCTEFLISQGADTNLSDNFGQTPVHIAVKYGMESMVALLLTGKNVEPKTPIRNTPKAKMFRKLRTYSPNSRPGCSKDINGKENETPVKTPTKKLYLTPERLEKTPGKEYSTPKTPKAEPIYGVLAFLAALGLEKYWPIFRDEEIDFETLITFDEENLKDIGIIRYGPRKKILKAIQEYRALHGGDFRVLKNLMWLK